MDYRVFFETATALGRKPYSYQERLARGEQIGQDDKLRLSGGTDCHSQLINIPTGLGKTAAVVLAWVWNRIVQPDTNRRATWPRRLVYCLPMRTLVEQTQANVFEWLVRLSYAAAPDDANVGKAIQLLSPDAQKLLTQDEPALRQYTNEMTSAKTDLLWLLSHSPVILMGGEDLSDEKREWDIYPEKPCIIIGTQDMLLSRALNRGYGMSRYRWPMHFGLLNNDCLWVMDETQLMGAGLWTSAQLDWLRENRFKPAINCTTWWMSATIGSAFLKTKDRKDAQLPDPTNIEITDIEAANLEVLKAVRPIAYWQPPLAKDRKNRTAFITALAIAISSEHKEHTLSLVVCNTVAAAQELFAVLVSVTNSQSEIILLTSRFRPADRKTHLDKLLTFENVRKAASKITNGVPAHKGLICVSTQVVEAGVDISARCLWAEHAPWPSTLQRLGRLNRDGKLNAEAAARIFSFPADKNNSSPYTPDDLKITKNIIDVLVKKSEAEPTKPIREILSELSSPNSNVQADIVKSLEPKPTTFPRAFEVHGLFSTEPDVFGGFTDVSRWVRGGDKNADVTVFWREWNVAKKSPNASDYTGPSFHRDEGCAVAIHRIRDFVKSGKIAFIWNDRVEKWERIRQDNICPGMVLMLPASNGGYDAAKGWTGKKTDKPANTPPPGSFDTESENNDKQTTAKSHWVALDSHLAAVAAVAKTVSEALALPPAQKNALVRAAALHDIGKSYSQWQNVLPAPRPDATTLWAKAPSFAKRSGMRHEAASALAAWRCYYRDYAADFPALTIYLVAAHHGFVRTVLNSRPAPAKQPNVAGIPITDPPPKLPVNDWQLDFSPASDGAEGTFSENANGELVFTPVAPGWSALVADLLGGWEADAPLASAGAVPTNNNDEPHSLNPFHLAFLETLLRAADCRVSASEAGITIKEAAKQ
jgi:CRISPR-associated endonuclease/helicase Cas3